jgi:hypothetical protein
MMDSTTQLAIAELVIYLIFFQLGTYLLYKHGRPGLEAWLFFTMFCVLRIIAAALQIADYNTYIKKGKTAPNTASIVNSIGVAGMLLTISGMIHEAYVTTLPSDESLERMEINEETASHTNTTTSPRKPKPASSQP